MFDFFSRHLFQKIWLLNNFQIFVFFWILPKQRGNQVPRFPLFSNHGSHSLQFVCSSRCEGDAKGGYHDWISIPCIPIFNQRHKLLSVTANHFHLDKSYLWEHLLLLKNLYFFCIVCETYICVWKFWPMDAIAFTYCYLQFIPATETLKVLGINNIQKLHC